MKSLPFISFFRSATENPATEAPKLDPKFDVKQYAEGGQFANATVIDIAMIMTEAPNDEIKYKFSKLMIEKTKVQFVDKMKEQREKEKSDKDKALELRQAAVAEYRDRLNKLFDAEFLEEFATITADYHAAGHGELITSEVFAKKQEDGTFKAEFSSNITKVRAKSATTSAKREGGATGAGVWVGGTSNEKAPIKFSLPRTEFKSFADFARHAGYVTDGTDLKGVNCKREYVERFGFSFGYLEPKPATDAPKTETAAIRVPVATR